MKIELKGDKLALYSIGVAFVLYGLDKIFEFADPKNPFVIASKVIIAIFIFSFGVLILCSIKKPKKS